VEGAGVPKDMAEGERLLKKAAAAGSRRAAEMLEKLAARTQPSQTAL
jgi:TPR repeat protein